MPDETLIPIPPVRRDSTRPVDSSASQPAAPIDGPPQDDTASKLLPHPIVGIGASAGGLEAYVELLKGLSSDTGMAFVIVPHLAPGSESHLTQILARNTAMPVLLIEDGARPEPNRVYVLPPGKVLTVSGGRLRLDAAPGDGRAHLLIDRFFRSLAADQGNRAIGVVLSGADSDGALGLKAIRGEGGISVVQDPDSAQFSSMPRSGILADHVDLVLPPAEIGHELARLARRFYTPELEPLERGVLPEEDEPHFSRIVNLLRNVSGIDFRQYKPATLRRRTARRMMLRRFDRLPEYAAYLQSHPDELRALQEDVLINLTRFFRDPEMFDALTTQVFPRLFENRPPDQQVRVWVAGCSTGEESYSVAMCLIEYLAGKAVEPPIQVFGTDASEQSIERARAALYPLSIAGDVSPERLKRFFVKVDAGYQISKRVRDLCIFARQNLCSDPPFSRLDLVSCRNVLIYLGAEVQQRVITTFHYALNANGCLLLGNAESLREQTEFFVPMDRKNKVYAKADNSARVIPDPIPRLAPSEVFAAEFPLARGHAGGDQEVHRAADRIVLARYSPAAVVINSQMEVLHVRGRTAPYIHVAAGTASLNLLRMLPDGIGLTIGDAVRRAIKEEIPVTIDDVSVRDGDAVLTFAVDILPIPGLPQARRNFLVVFAPRSPAPTGLAPLLAPPSDSSPDDLQREVVSLHHDISSSRLYLQSLIEEREGRNQELTSAYEELQSANEELQSTNEELETAKEELQSANEELQTVNEELRNRNLALVHANNDVANLLNSVNIPVVMLGSDLTIRHFTPPVERLMRIRRQDIGRPISEIRLNLSIDNLEPLLQEVLDTLATRQLDVQDGEGHWHILRVRPYRTAENKIEGVVMVLLDVDEIRRGQDAMRQARDFSQAVVDMVPVPFVVLDRDLRVRSANEAFRSLSKMADAELERRSFPELAGLLWDAHALRDRLQRLATTLDGNTAFELEHEIPGNSACMFRFTGHAVGRGSERWMLVVVQDITTQKQAERLLMSERDQLSGEVHLTSAALERTKNDLRALAMRLFSSQEDERRRVARELHDDVGQKLALLEIETEQLRQSLADDPEAAQLAIDALRNRVAELSNDVRAISHGLHPSVLDDLGLGPALKALVEEFGEREKMLVTFSRRKVPASIPREVAASLFRIAQEALRNVAKHAGQAHVKVSLEGLNGNVRLSVRDSGDGFDTSGAASRGLGLISMEERARLVNGVLKLGSELGEGTQVVVTVPLPHDGEESQG